jgi:hypothetical protein
MGAPRLSAAILAVALAGQPWTAGPALGQQLDNRTIEGGVRDLLQQYSMALESLDAAAVKKVQPSIDEEVLRAAFREMRSLDVTIDDVKLLSSEALSARVSCRVTQTLTPRAGSRRTTAVTRVIRVRRQDGSWVIDAFER